MSARLPPLAIVWAALMAVLVAPDGASAATTSFNPVADAYVASSAPAANYGTLPTLKVDGSPVLRSYLRFSVAGLDQPVKRATLRFYTSSSSTSGIGLHGVSSSAWGEGTITYGNAPTFGAQAARSAAFGAGSWVSVDATALVSSNGAISLGLATGSATSKTLSSREAGAQSPQLVVETAEPPPPPPPPPTSDPVIAAAGDIACNDSDPNFNGGAGTAFACRHQATSDLLAAGNFARVLALGDIQYETGELAKYQSIFDPTWGRFKSITSPAIGNHEYGVPGAAGYFDYFNGVGNADGPAGDRSKGYYSYDVGSWHVVALNSNCSIVSCAAGSAQEQWLRADLAAHPTSCTLAYWHHPRFASAVTKIDALEVSPLWQALYEAGAEAVLSGHAHFYERFAPQRADGSADPSYGLRGFTVGTGGKSHHGLSSTSAANSEVRESDTYGILKLTLRAGSYDWGFVPEAGRSFSDSGTGTCHGAPPAQPPPQPPAPQPPSPESLTFTPSDDTTAKPDFPNANYGTYGQVESDASPVERGYLKFGVAGVGSRRVTSAKLRLFVTNPSDAGGSFYRVASNAWSEGTLTAANAPLFDASPFASLGTVNYQTWYEVDVTSLVRGDGSFSIGMSSTSADGVDYASKERGADLAPQLRVTVEP